MAKPKKTFPTGTFADVQALRIAWKGLAPDQQLQALLSLVQEWGYYGQFLETNAEWRPLTTDSHPEEGQLVALWSPTGFHEIREWHRRGSAKFTHWHPETRPAPPSTRIDDQDVSVRFTILCERSGIATVNDLAERGEAALRSAGFTAKTLKEARALLAQHKLHEAQTSRDGNAIAQCADVLAAAVEEAQARPFPFADTFERAECEAAVALLVMACEHHGDEFKPLTPREVGEALKVALEREPWKTWGRNPFFNPDIRDLVEHGFAEFLGDPGKNCSVQLTAEAMARLEKWRKPRG